MSLRTMKNLQNSLVYLYSTRPLNHHLRHPDASLHPLARMSGCVLPCSEVAAQQPWNRFNSVKDRESRLVWSSVLKPRVVKSSNPTNLPENHQSSLNPLRTMSNTIGPDNPLLRHHHHHHHLHSNKNLLLTNPLRRSVRKRRSNFHLLEHHLRHKTVTCTLPSALNHRNKLPQHKGHHKKLRRTRGLHKNILRLVLRKSHTAEIG